MAEVTAQTARLNKAMLDKEGKYLTFALAHEEYGLEILKVREIIGYMDITAVPQTPHHVKGVINLRGQVIPVIDLRAKFGMETTDVTEETCIIVVEISQGDHTFSTGIVVDHVQEVLDIAGEDIEEAPQFGSSVNTDFILGMGKIGETVKILLDIDRVLSSNDLVAFTGDSIEDAQCPAKETTRATGDVDQATVAAEPASEQAPQEQHQTEQTEQPAEGEPQ